MYFVKGKGGVRMKHILVVDDDRFNLVVAYDALKKYYRVSVANSGREALQILDDKEIDLILLDIEMPEMNGIDTLKIIKDNPQTAMIPVIFLTGINNNDVEAKCIELGAQDYIIKPFYEPAMLVRIKRILELEGLRKHLELMVAEKTKEVECLTIQTITSFANSIDAKDSYTKHHSQHVAKLAEKMARKLGWDINEIRNLYYSALLHDIGKIGIPDYILNKPGKLTADEMEIIRKHPVIGGEILSEVTVVPFLSIGASSHHERFDGSGYPAGKKGEEIPLVGRIVCIADSVDAIISTRAYREAGTVNFAMDELKRCSGTQFDPDLVPIMIEILEEGIEFLDEEYEPDDDGSLITTVLHEYTKATQLDSLTGLWNKAYIQSRINELLYLPERQGAFLLIDIDSFRRVNNFCGHDKGDAMIVSLAQGLLNEISRKDFAGRIDNDKFVVYLNEIRESQEVEEKIVQILKSMKKRITDLDLPVKINVSIGAAIPSEKEKDYMSLYHNADKALYYTKREVKKGYYIYREDHEENWEIQGDDNTVDIWYLKIILAERAAAKGIYRVEVNEFEKIFKLLQRKSKRSGEPLSMVLFTLVSEEDDKVEPLELDEIAKHLMVSMDKVLRAGDIATQYSNSQQIVLLTGVNVEGAKGIVQRVEEFFAELNINTSVTLKTEIEKVV